MPAEDFTGVTLGARYRVTELLGAGGMGQVYAGLDETLDRRVAIKVLLRKLADDVRFRERFLREAKAASKIQHPNVVQIIDFGETPSGSVFYAMEFLAGRDLAAVLRADGPLPWSRARNILLQIVKALGATHDRNIIHRDIKPANFFVVKARGHHDFIKLLDFGIAKFAADPAQDEKSLALSLTGAGEVMGTAKYMAPEQAYGSSDDPRVDVYAVGIVAYEVLTGTVPFKGSSVFEILKQHVDTPPRPPRELNPEIPAEVEAIVLRALAKDQQARFDSMDEFEAALASVPALSSASAVTPGPRPPRKTMPFTSAAPSTAVMDQRASSEALEASRQRAVALEPAVSPPREAAAPQHPRPSSISELATAPRRVPDESPSSPVGSTMVVATQPRTPSSVTYGQLGGEPGAPAETFVDPSSAALGSSPSVPVGVTSVPSRPSDSSASGSTSRIATKGDVGGTTGPTSSVVAIGAETDPHALTMTDRSVGPARRGRGVAVGVLAVGVAIVSALGVTMMRSGDDEVEPREAEVAVAGGEEEVPSEVVSVGAEPVEVNEAEVAVESSGAAGVEPEPSEPETSEVAPEAPKPEPEPEPAEPVIEQPDPTPPEPVAEEPKPKATKPKATKPKPSKPLTDAQVASRLGRRLSKACRNVGSGTVTIDLIVGSSGSVLSVPPKGASGELLKCLHPVAKKASFPSGSTRTVHVKVKF